MTQLTSAEGFLALLGLKGVGPKTALALSSRFATLAEARAADPSAFKKVANKEVARLLREDDAWMAAGLAHARSVLERAAELEAVVSTVHCPTYPARLAEVEDRPMVVSHFGNLGALDRSVAVYGGREQTELGAKVADRLCGFLAESGWSLAAGVERGASAIAHDACARVRRPSVAVVASGIERYRSDRQMEVAQAVHDGGGAILGEQPFGTDSDPATTIRSLRIRSGASAALLVVQADLTTETMHAVRYALQQGRRVLAPVLPPRVAMEDESRGTVALTSLTGRQLADAFDVNEDFRRLLEERFANEPVATPIASRADYDSVLAMLDEALEPSPDPDASPRP